MRSDAGLVRVIGIRTLTAAIVNATIGAGIFVLPAEVANELGTGAPFAYLVCALAMLFVVGSLALAGSRVSITGGIYAYIDAAFGPYVGFLGGVLQLLNAVLAASSVSAALVGSVAVMLPAAGEGIGRGVLLGAIFGGLAFVNIRGVRQGARTVEVVTLAKLLPLTLFVIVGAAAIGLGNLPRPTFPEIDALGRTALVLLFAFAGAEMALASSGEVRNPARTVPVSLFAALATTTAFYLAIQFVAQGVLGPDLARFADAPLAQAASRLVGAAGLTLMLLGAVVSMFGYVSGDVLGNPRGWFAFGRDGYLPAVVGAVHPRFRTPYVAIVIHAVTVFLLAFFGTFVKLALLANIAVLSLYLLGCLAAFELRRRDVRLADAPFSFPGASVVPFIGAGVVIWLLSHATREEFAAEAVVLAVATVLFLLRRRTAMRQRAAREQVDAAEPEPRN